MRALRAAGVSGRVWIAVDGLYSMHGDYAPQAGIEQVMADFDDVWAYVDDAHGVSWQGRRGEGSWWPFASMPQRTVVAGSLAKSFGATGGLLSFGDISDYRAVRAMAGSLIFSGPLPPPMLAAAAASLRMHAQGEVADRQVRLRESIVRMGDLLAAAGVVSAVAPAPIMFVPVGGTTETLKAVTWLRQRGFHTNYAMWPVVPEAQAGVRFTVTTHLTDDDLEWFAATLAGTLAQL